MLSRDLTNNNKHIYHPFQRERRFFFIYSFHAINECDEEQEGGRRSIQNRVIFKEDYLHETIFQYEKEEQVIASLSI
jgi:hypothetical protein